MALLRGARTRFTGSEHAFRGVAGCARVPAMPVRALATRAPPPPASAAPSDPGPSSAAGRALAPGLVGAPGALHSKTGLLLRCTIFDRHGTARVVSGSFDKYALCSEYGLEVRDLRKIDSRVPNVVPTILARRGAFMVNMLHIRALVKHDTVLLFDGYGADNSQLHSAFVYNLEHNLRLSNVHHRSSSAAEGLDHLPYEFRALEAILASVLEALHIELEGIRQLVFALLASLDHNIDREKLRALLAYRRRVGELLARSRGAKGAVAEILESDEDMALMHLTDAAAGHPRTAQSLACVYDSLELLLESFDKQLEEVISYTEQMQDNIGGTQEIVELILDSNRNQLLALELHVSIATLGFTGGALIASFFGMNLHTGLEENPIAFLVVTAGSLAVVASFSLAGLRRISQIQRIGLGNARRTPLSRPLMRVPQPQSAPWSHASIAQNTAAGYPPGGPNPFLQTSPSGAAPADPAPAGEGASPGAPHTPQGPFSSQVHFSWPHGYAYSPQSRGGWWHWMHARLPRGRTPHTRAPRARHAPPGARAGLPGAPAGPVPSSASGVSPPPGLVGAKAWLRTLLLGPERGRGASARAERQRGQRERHRG